MRSPEMLLSSSNLTAEQDGGGKHKASDVWALGCLLYELVTGTVLFPNELDWPKFFITVTDPTQVQKESLGASSAIKHTPNIGHWVYHTRSGSEATGSTFWLRLDRKKRSSLLRICVLLDG